jgi:hypothetical protein
LSKRKTEEIRQIYDPYELAELRFRLAYIKYKIEKWKQGKESEEEKKKEKQ